MVRSMYSGTLGLQAHQLAMDIEGHNIANVNTVGFKYSRANFSEMLSQTMRGSSAPTGEKGGTNGLQVGLGAEVNSSTKIFKQGSFQKTDNNTDLALDGDGMFVVSNDGGRTNQYTRAGNFDFDVAGNLVDPSGNIVQGWNIDANYEVDSTKPIRGIQINPKLKIGAKATSSITAKGNLNSEESIKTLFNLKDGETVTINGTKYTYTDKTTPGTGEFNTADQLATAMKATIVDGKFKIAKVGDVTSVSGDNADLVNALTPLMSGTESKKVAPYYAMSIDVYDSLGEKHTVNVKFTRTVAAASPTTAGAAGTATTQNRWKMTIEAPVPVTIDGANANRQVEGTVAFNSDGSIASLTPQSFTMNANNGSAGAQKIALNFGSKFDGLSSFANISDISDQNQNGFTGGNIKEVNVNGSGSIIGTFTSGETIELGKVAVAQFRNNEGLSSIGSNLYASTPSSGDPTIGVAGRSGRADIVSSTLEMSNADLSKSLTQLIVIQRGYQANSKTITTADTMLDTLIQIKR